MCAAAAAAAIVFAAAGVHAAAASAAAVTAHAPGPGSALASITNGAAMVMMFRQPMAAQPIAARVLLSDQAVMQVLVRAEGFIPPFCKAACSTPVVMQSLLLFCVEHAAVVACSQCTITAGDGCSQERVYQYLMQMEVFNRAPPSRASLIALLLSSSACYDWKWQITAMAAYTVLISSPLLHPRAFGITVH